MDPSNDEIRREIHDQISQKNKQMEEVKEKAKNDETTAANKIENKFKPIISEIETKISIEKNNLENILKKINDLQPKKEKSNTALKLLKNKSEITKKEKKNDLNQRINEIGNDNPSIKKVSAVIEEKTTKSNLNLRIEELKTKLEGERKTLDTTMKNIELLNEKKKEIANKIKDLNNKREEIDHEKKIAVKMRLKEFLENKFQMIKQPIENEINKNYYFKLNDLKEKIGIKKKELNEVIKLLEEPINKKNEFKKIESLERKKTKLNAAIKEFEREYKKILKVKQNTMKIEIDELNIIKNEIKKLSFDEKVNIENQIENEYKNKIAELELERSKQNIVMFQINFEFAASTKDRNVLSSKINLLMKELKDLSDETFTEVKLNLSNIGHGDNELALKRVEKEIDAKYRDKINDLNSQVKNETSEFLTLTENYVDLLSKKKAIEKNVKLLEKQNEEVYHQKKLFFNSELKKLYNNRDANIKLIRKEIKDLNKDLKILIKAIARGI